MLHVTLSALNLVFDRYFSKKSLCINQRSMTLVSMYEEPGPIDFHVRKQTAVRFAIGTLPIEL